MDPAAALDYARRLKPLREQFVGSHIPQAYMRLVRSSSPGSEEVVSQDGTRRVLGYVPPAVQPSVTSERPVCDPPLTRGVPVAVPRGVVAEGSYP